jgi:predicted dithiol-disulfide oxidoreductase (DUF899 family)
MTKHKTGTREEWLAARFELLKAEKELGCTRALRRRNELPRPSQAFKRRRDAARARAMVSARHAQGSPAC